MSSECHKPLTILVLSGDMEKGLAACNLALAALSCERPTTLFFSFWGLNFLKRPGAKPRRPAMGRILGFLNRDHAGRQRLGRFNLFGAGRRALLNLMGRHKMQDVQEGLAQARQMGARIVACSNTLQLMGLDREDLVSEVDEVAGAICFLDAADGATVVTLS